MMTAAIASPSVDPVISRLRPRSVGEVIDQAFRLYRGHFLTFLAIIAIVHVPLQMIVQAASVLFVGQVGGIFEAGAGGTTSSYNTDQQLISTLIAEGAIVALSLLYWLFMQFAQAALTVGVADIYLEKPLSFGGAYRAMFRHAGPVLGVIGLQMLIGVGIFLPIILIIALSVGATIADSSSTGAIVGICAAYCLIVPALLLFVYVLTRLSVAVPALLVENLGPREALSRSWGLVNTSWWRTFGLLAVLYILQMIVAQGPAALVQIVALVVVPKELVIQQVVGGTLTVLTTLLYIPIQLVALTLYYFDLRVRKEGFDLESAITRRYEQYGSPPIRQASAPGGYATYGRPQPGPLVPPALGYSAGEASRGYPYGYSAPVYPPDTSNPAGPPPAEAPTESAGSLGEAAGAEANPTEEMAGEQGEKQEER